MGYNLVPGVVNQVRPAPMNGPLGSVAAGALGVGLLGAAMGGAIEYLFIYGCARLGADVAPAKAKKTALWAGGIVFGLSAVMTLAAAGGIAAAESQQQTAGFGWGAGRHTGI